MNSNGHSPLNAIDEGISLRVHVTPKSSADCVLGLYETPDGPTVKLKVRADPANGAANNAVEKLVAKWLNLPKSSVKLHSGGKSRVKLLHVRGEGTTLVGIVSTKLQGFETIK